jgi:hypothetical protein
MMLRRRVMAVAVAAVVGVVLVAVSGGYRSGIDG